MHNKFRLALLVVFVLCAVIPIRVSANVSDLVAQGESALSSGDFAAAKDFFARAVKSTPGDLRLRFSYAQCLHSLEEYEASLSQLQVLLRNAPNNFLALEYAAMNLVRLEREAEAELHIDKLLRLSPDHENALAMKAAVAKNLKNTEAIAVAPEKKKAQTQVRVQAQKEKEERPKKQKNSQAQAQAQKIEARPPSARKVVTEVAVKMPAAALTETWDIQTFLEKGKDSFMVNLEYAKFAMEVGDLERATRRLQMAEHAARNDRDTKRFIEVQVLNSLIHVYNLDFKAFGQNLMRLRPTLTANAYKSFLDVFNQGFALEQKHEQARLAAGIAMGASHYAIASKLFSQALEANPGDVLLAGSLSESQLMGLDYAGAEKTLKQLAVTDDESPEPYINLARFYLTASFDLEKARQNAARAREINHEDPRIEVILALADYAEGHLEEGINRMTELMPSLQDESFKNICAQIITNGKQFENHSDSTLNFSQILALPGAAHAHRSSFRQLGDEMLHSGSLFNAMRNYVLAGEKAEVGRVYLALASSLATADEQEMAAIAAGYGLRALKEAGEENPASGRAGLYMAIYWNERGDNAAAKSELTRAIEHTKDPKTLVRLKSFLESLDS